MGPLIRIHSVEPHTGPIEGGMLVNLTGTKYAHGDTTGTDKHKPSTSAQAQLLWLMLGVRRRQLRNTNPYLFSPRPRTGHIQLCVCACALT